jgi:hypothetical protein
MANDYRDRDRYRDGNRGMFGYEGEGYMRGGARGDEYSTGFAGGYGTDRGFDRGYNDRGYRSGPSGYRDLESGTDRGWNIGRDTDRGTTSYRGRGPKNYQRSDERIREDVCERLAMDDDIDASEIEINVAEGVVTLNGSVNERHAKRMAEDVCENVRGVKDVQNNLRVTR